MREILGKAKTVRELLKGVKYSIDYYQREYKWHEKQIRELVDDLSDKFLEEYQPSHPRTKVADYPHYFLGSIIISKKDSVGYIVDGQQRLTSLTLLLVLLRNLQKDQAKQVNVDELIFSEKFDQKSFNLHVDERTPAMESLYEGQPFDVTDRPESVQNLVQRYRDLETCFPEELRDDALPYFIDWLLENVHLVEITAYSDDDAYTIFETMNDRGLSLSPTDMLKGYLLANIDENKRTAANARWRDRIRELNDSGKEVESDCFKGWLRSQHATKIRERKKGAKPEDFDRIGTEFHRWLRDAADTVGLKQSDDFYRFIDRDFDFYSRQYLRLIEAAQEPLAGLEHVLYNAQHGFTLQNMLLLAPLRPDDGEKVVVRKIGLVAQYLDILLTWRLWNFRTIAYSTMQYAMFVVMRDIRGLAPDALAHKLHDFLTKEGENFASNDRLRMHQQNRYPLHRILARLTDYVETRSGQPSHYVDYVSEGKTRYEVEHIWADHPERHTDEFSHAADFAEHRNRIGGLLLLPKSFNASYGDLTYEKKLPHYNTQNLLARSLHPQCYEHNPGFLRFVQERGLPFKSYPQFKKADLDERGTLYRLLAEQIWNPDDLLREVGQVIADLKPYPAMKDSGVQWLGEVPNHWEVRRQRNVVEMRVSNVDKHSEDDERPARLCNYVDVYKNERITDRISFMRVTATPQEIERFRLRTGDVLITKDSEVWNDIGVPALVEYTAPDLVCGYHLALLRPREGLMTGSFLLRALQCPAVAYQFHVLANGVTRYGLSHDAIKSVLLPVPPEPEQSAIVRFLDSADRRIRRYILVKQKLIKLLEGQKQAIIHRAVTRGLNPHVRLKSSGVEWLGDVPEHWEVRRAKDLFREVDIRSTTGTEVLLSLRMYRGLVPHHEVSAIPITAPALIGFKNVTPGQIVMNRMRAAIGMFGVVSQLGLVSPDYAVLEPGELVEASYFLLLFKTQAAGTVFRMESKGLGTGSSGFMRLYTDRFGIIKLPVPTRDEQRAIVQGIAARTAELDHTLDRIIREISLLREYRIRLIADVVTGKLDVRGGAAKLLEETDESEPLDDAEILAESDEKAEGAGFDAVSEEAEA